MAPFQRDKELKRQTVDKIILPALHRGLSRQEAPTTAACLMALAKIGRQTEDFPLLPILRSHLPSQAIGVQETAALSLGISRNARAAPLLSALLLDNRTGRDLCKCEEVDIRTRCFATWGLAYLARRIEDRSVTHAALSAFESALRDETITDPNLRSALITAIGLTSGKPNSEGDRAGLLQAFGALEKEWDLSPDESLRNRVRAHVPMAMAHLLEHAQSIPALADRALRVRKSWIAAIQARSSRSIAQSCVLALLASPVDPVPKTAYAAAQASDNQLSHFAIMGLARFPAKSAETALTLQLAKAVHFKKTWAALALGARGVYELKRGETPPADISEQIQKQFFKTKNPRTQASMAIALGLRGFKPAIPALRLFMKKQAKKDEFCGYLAVALALLGDDASLAEILRLASSSSGRPKRLAPLVEALARLAPAGHPATIKALLILLRSETNSSRVHGSLARALGTLGDETTAVDLVAILNDDSTDESQRAAAASALGILASSTGISWNAELASRVNYRVLFETMTNGVDGVLDRL